MLWRIKPLLSLVSISFSRDRQILVGDALRFIWLNFIQLMSRIASSPIVLFWKRSKQRSTLRFIQSLCSDYIVTPYIIYIYIYSGDIDVSNTFEHSNSLSPLRCTEPVIKLIMQSPNRTPHFVYQPPAPMAGIFDICIDRNRHLSKPTPQCCASPVHLMVLWYSLYI